MRIIEPEGRIIAYFIVIVTLILLYFNFYILSAICFFLLLPAWLFFCSSKIVNLRTPSVPNAIIAPISGKILDITQDENSITFSIKPRFNGRIYAPSDLSNISITHTYGFYGFSASSKISAFCKILNAKDTLKATSLIDGQNINIKICLTPFIFPFCALKFEAKNSLFLEKLGFLNLGILTITITHPPTLKTQPLIQKSDTIIGGSTPLTLLPTP